MDEAEQVDARLPTNPRCDFSTSRFNEGKGGSPTKMYRFGDKTYYGKYITEHL